MLLTAENYKKGFLMDDQLMGGVTEHPELAGMFVAFVFDHTRGEYLAYQPFPTLEEALNTLSLVKRDWKFEKAGGCGGGGCGGGGCGGGGCGGGGHHHGPGDDHDHAEAAEEPKPKRSGGCGGGGGGCGCGGGR